MVTAHEYQNSPNSVYAIKLHAQHTHYTTTLGQPTPVMPTARSIANRNGRYQPTDTPGTHHAVTLYNPTSDCVTYTVQRWLDHTGKEEEQAQPPHLLCVNNLLCIVHRILHKPNYQALTPATQARRGKQTAWYRRTSTTQHFASLFGSSNAT